jgi:hypothetical protein
MAITKQVHNTGSTGGHGMQEIDVLKRRMLEDKYQEEKSTNRCHCGNGHTFDILGEVITRREETLLSNHIRMNNLCPFCHRDNKGSINFQYCVENQNKLMEYCFERDGKSYHTIHKPSGYKFLPPDDIDE